jgi:hypothetical protein
VGERCHVRREARLCAQAELEEDAFGQCGLAAEAECCELSADAGQWDAGWDYAWSGYVRKSFLR